MSYEPINLVSVAIVAYNEAEVLEAVLSDILAQDFPRSRMELLLVDSESTDATRSLMEFFARGKEAASFARVLVLDNPKRILPAGCNVAIRMFTGDALVRIDAHARIPSDFVSQSVAVLEEGEDVCGGPRPVVAFPKTPWSITLLLAEESAFGSSVADYRGSSEKEYVSASFHAMFRREVIDAVGMYDERLVRTEDNDYFYRIRRLGYRIRFDRRIRSQQIARNDLKRMMKQKYGNGYWIGRTMHVQPKCFQIYHFAPLVFVLGILLLIVAGIAISWWPFVVCASLYALACIALSAKAVASATEKVVHMLALPLVFFGIHASYGVGTLFGLVKGALLRLKG